MAKKVIPEKTPIPEQAPELRITNFNEVVLGYNDDQAVIEANRSLQCKKPVCIAGCPVGIDIPRFVDMVVQRDFKRAVEIIREKMLCLLYVAAFARRRANASWFV